MTLLRFLPLNLTRLAVNSKAGTLDEAMETRASWEAWQNSDEAQKERIKARKAKRAQAMDRIRSKMRLVSTSLC